MTGVSPSGVSNGTHAPQPGHRSRTPAPGVAEPLQVLRERFEARGRPALVDAVRVAQVPRYPRAVPERHLGAVHLGLPSASSTRSVR